MHWGGYSDNVDPVPFVDFHLARHNTVQFTNEEQINRIPLVSYNFIPSRFRKLDLPVEWDVISVGWPRKHKRNSDLLAVIRDLYEEGTEVTALFITPRTSSGFLDLDHDFFKIYNQDFSDKQRQNITIASPVIDDDNFAFAIPNKIMPYLYNASKVCAHFSRLEGNPKVIHEALLCGRPVIVRDDMKGSGQDYLNEENSVILSELGEAKYKLMNVINNIDQYHFDSSPLRNEICEEGAVPKLKSELEDLFADLGVPFEGDLRTAELWKCLPSHHTTVPRKYCRQNSSDLKSRRSLYLYSFSLLEQEPSMFEQIDLITSATMRRISKRGFYERTASKYLYLIDRRVGVPIYNVTRNLYYRLRRDAE
jgi:hypothetical protein